MDSSVGSWGSVDSSVCGCVGSCVGGWVASVDSCVGSVDSSVGAVACVAGIVVSVGVEWIVDVVVSLSGAGMLHLPRRTPNKMTGITRRPSRGRRSRFFFDKGTGY